MNAFLERGRAEKVARIAEQVEAFAREEWVLDAHGDAEEIALRLVHATDVQWLEWQRRAGYKRKEPPSRETRTCVIERFEKRRDREAG